MVIRGEDSVGEGRGVRLVPPHPLPHPISLSLVHPISPSPSPIPPNSLRTPHPDLLAHHRIPNTTSPASSPVLQPRRHLSPFQEGSGGKR